MLKYYINIDPDYILSALLWQSHNPVYAVWPPGCCSRKSFVQAIAITYAYYRHSDYSKGELGRT